MSYPKIVNHPDIQWLINIHAFQIKLHLIESLGPSGEKSFHFYFIEAAK